MLLIYTMFKFAKKIYSFFKGLIATFIKRLLNFSLPNKFNTRVEFQDAPVFNQVTLCEGKGVVKIANGCIFGYKLGGFHRGGSIELQSRYIQSVIQIGDNVSTNNNVLICAANYIEIGSDSLIGQNVTIMDHEAHGISPLRRRELGEIGKVIVGHNVWIGSNVTILKNSKIGSNSIVAAGAVVSGEFPENVIIGGVPAKIIGAL